MGRLAYLSGAHSHLQTAAADVSRLQDDVRNVAAIDQTATAATIEHLQAESAGARSAVDDRVFRAATAVPWIGPNLEAVREVTVTVDSLATEVMPSLAQVAGTVSPSALAPRHGAIELAPIEQASAALQHADRAVNAARSRVAGIDRSDLIAPVGDAVLTLSRALEGAAALTGNGARAARLLPPM